MKRFLYLLSTLSLVIPVLLHIVGGFSIQVYLFSWFFSISFIIGCVEEFIDQFRK